MRTNPLIGLTALCPLLLAPAMSRAESNSDSSVPNFRPQQIDKSLGVGYGVKLVDLNGDGRTDIVVADSARVIWFENPGKSAGRDTPWKLHTILDDKKAGLKTDNVCIDAYDIDGDGKLDLVLGADWQFTNTKAGGSLQWLRQGANIDEAWTVHPILPVLPTLHRVHFGKLDGPLNGKPQLIVGPLRGTGSTGPNYTDVASHLLVYDIPKDPANDKWEPRVLNDQLHTLHNFTPIPAIDPRTGAPLPGDHPMQVLTASYEGVNLLTPTSDGKAELTQLGAGDQSKPNGNRGSSEVKIGHLKTAKGTRTFLATVEPFHGNQVVVYTPPAGADEAGKAGQTEKSQKAGLWTRKVLDDRIHEGHGVWCADLDGDGSDELIVGWRQGPGAGIRIYKAKPSTGDGAPEWSTHDLDIGGVAVEDLAAADLDGDGRIDIVAVGRATHNVRIYWNEGQK